MHDYHILSNAWNDVVVYHETLLRREVKISEAYLWSLKSAWNNGDDIKDY